MKDFAGSLHAVCLLGLIFISCMILVFSKKRSLRVRHLIPALLGVLVIFVAGIMEGRHKCFSGDPTSQWIIPIMCFIPVSLFVSNKCIRRLCGGFIIITALALSHQYVVLVHKEMYTGNQSHILSMNRKSNGVLSCIREELMEYSISNNAYLAEGWLSNSLNQANINYEPFKLPVTDIHTLWHTWLTDLYYTEDCNLDYWCAGGSLSNSKGIISLKRKHQQHDGS